MEFKGLSGSASLNLSDNSTIFVEGNILNFIALNSILAPLYLLLVILPSVFTNGAVIVLFAKNKDVRSPFNLLTVNQCISGLFSNLINGTLTFIFYPISLYYGSCAIESVILATTIWTQFGISTINIAAISVGIYVTLKYNNASNKLTYKKVLIVMAVVWIYPGLWAAMLSFITRNIRSLRCLLYTDEFNIPVSDVEEYNLQTSSLYQIVLYISRDVIVDVIPRVLVVVFCIASYRLFRKSTINPPEDLTRKMLLLPVLTTIMSTVVNLFSGVLLIAVNNGYGAVTTSLENFDRSPLFFVQTIIQFLVEYNTIAYICCTAHLLEQKDTSFLQRLHEKYISLRVF